MDSDNKKTLKHINEIISKVNSINPALSRTYISILEDHYISNSTSGQVSSTTAAVPTRIVKQRTLKKTCDCYGSFYFKHPSQYKMVSFRKNKLNKRQCVLRLECKSCKKAYHHLFDK